MIQMKWNEKMTRFLKKNSFANATVAATRCWESYTTWKDVLTLIKKGLNQLLSSKASVEQNRHVKKLNTIKQRLLRTLNAIDFNEWMSDFEIINLRVCVSKPFQVYIFHDYHKKYTKQHFSIHFSKIFAWLYL